MTAYCTSCMAIHHITLPFHGPAQHYLGRSNSRQKGRQISHVCSLHAALRCALPLLRCTGGNLVCSILAKILPETIAANKLGRKADRLPIGLTARGRMYFVLRVLTPRLPYRRAEARSASLSSPQRRLSELESRYASLGSAISRTRR